MSTLSGLASIAYKAWNGLEAVLLRFFQHGLTDSILNVSFHRPSVRIILSPFIRFTRLLGMISQTACIRYSCVFPCSWQLSLITFFQRFLSKEMQYSCPIWSELEGGVRGDLENGRFPGDLESAQATKIKYILDKTRLRPGDRLLEIGR